MRKQLEIEPEKFRPQYRVRKIFRVGGKNYRVGRISGNNKFFRPNFCITGLHVTI